MLRSTLRTVLRLWHCFVLTLAFTRRPVLPYRLAVLIDCRERAFNTQFKDDVPVLWMEASPSSGLEEHGSSRRIVNYPGLTTKAELTFTLTRIFHQTL